jgi:hypothetical protein
VVLAAPEVRAAVLASVDLAGHGLDLVAVLDSADRVLAHRDFCPRGLVKLLPDVRRGARHNAVAEVTSVTRRAKKVR